MARVDAFGVFWGVRGRLGAPFWEPGAPKMTPRDATERKVEKNTRRSLFQDPK